MRTSVPVRAISVATGTRHRDVQELAAAAGLSDADRATLTAGGLRAVPVADIDLVGLVDEVVDALDVGAVRHVVFAHSLPLSDGLAALLTEKLAGKLRHLEQAPLFLAGRPCSILHLGIELAARRWEHADDGEVLLIGGDVATDHNDRFFFGSAMGDAAVGVLLGGAATFGTVIAVHSTWNVIAADGTASDPDDISRFRAQNPTAIRATITGALHDAGLDWSDLTAIVPHTPYRGIWDTVAELCRYPRDRILDDGIADTGHLNSNDVVLHLTDAIRSGRLRSLDLAALVSPGFGGTRGCTLVRIS